MSDPNVSPEQGKNPPPKPHDMPAHIFKELLHLSEKVGILEGMMEVMMKQQRTCHCEYDHNNNEK